MQLCGRLYTRADRQSTSDACGLAHVPYELYNRLGNPAYQAVRDAFHRELVQGSAEAVEL